jgi:hypothetical protein
MLDCIVPKRCGCGEPFFVAALSLADTLLTWWQTKFEQAMCPACSTRFELGIAQAALAMGEPAAALLHLRRATERQNDDAGDEPCAICPIQGCNGAHCFSDADAYDKAVSSWPTI